MSTIGLFGGTFDPIHIGHVVVATEAKMKFNLDKVVFIPSGQPPHKNKSKASKEDRLEMVKLALIDYTNYECSDVEIKKKGPSYAVDTVKHYKDISNKNDELFYITGIDIMETIVKWKSPMELLNLCDFIVVTRPGYDFTNFQKILEGKLCDFKSSIHLLETRKVDVSASMIRDKAGKGQNIIGLVSERVGEYIKEKGLYSC